MSYFKRPVLLMFLGSPGSGKSYFARAVADKISAIRLNSDSMRLSIFGSLEEMDRIRKAEGRTKLNDYTFNALNYVAEQILSRGHDVVYDAHSNRRIDRANLEQIAARYHAVPVLVWIKTPIEVAIKRGQTRDAQVDQRQISEEKMREVITRHLAETDEPESSESVIVIDGEMPFEQQFEAFTTQMEKING